MQKLFSHKHTEARAVTLNQRISTFYCKDYSVVIESIPRMRSELNELKEKMARIKQSTVFVSKIEMDNAV